MYKNPFTEIKEDKFTTTILFMILTVALVGALTMPYNVTPLIFISSTGYEINYLTFFLGRVICGIGLVFFLTLIVRFVIRPDLSKLVHKTDVFVAAKECIKITSEQKFAALCCMIFLFCIFVPANLPKSWPGISLLSNLGLIGCGILIIILATVLQIYSKQEKGFRSIMNTNLFMKDTSWDIIFVIALTIPLANFLEDDVCGVFQLFMAFFGPLAI